MILLACHYRYHPCTMRGKMSKKKRKHSQFAQGQAVDRSEYTHNSGLASTLAHLNSQPGDRPKADDSDNEDWTVVERGGKKRKTNNYPTLVYANFHKQWSSIKISDLQTLALYCIADGTSPQWVSVQHHYGIKKAVVLFVPGLEKGMFDGKVALESLGSAEKDMKPRKNSVSTPDGWKADHVPSSVAFQEDNLVIHTSTESPDDYLPVRLAPDTLPDPLKPLTECFDYLWPVKTPGDDKFAKIFSPLHAMLNTPIPKSREQLEADKRKKGYKPVSSQHWENKRTTITHFFLSRDELEESEYVLHPAWFGVESEAATEKKRREDSKQTAEHGWVDTNVTRLEDAEVPAKHIEQGSISAGRTVLAMDCEMCKTEEDEMALTRISLVDWDGEIVMDELVKPHYPITDYLTP